MVRLVAWIAVVGCASAGTAWSGAAPSSGPRSDELAGYRTSAESAARGGHCEMSRQIGERVQALDPAYFQRAFVADPAIAACLAATPAPAPDPTLAVASDDPPPLEGTRIILEVLAGAATGLTGAFVGGMAGAKVPASREDVWMDALAGAYAGYVLTIPLGVAAIGDYGDEHGSLAAAYVGSLLGGTLGLLPVLLHDHDASTPAVLLAAAPLGAMVSFNLTRTYDAGVHHAPSWVPTASAAPGRAMVGIAGRF